MKTYFISLLTWLIFLCGMSIQSSIAQNWCPPGARFSYDNWSGFGYTWRSLVVYQKDTTILSTTCKKLTHYRIEYNLYTHKNDTSRGSDLITFERNDTVFFGNTYYPQPTIYPVYFWNAQVGDTLPYGYLNTEIRQVVDSAGIINVNGQMLRTYTVRPIVADSFMLMYLAEKITVIERVGASDNFLNPNLSLANDYGLTFRCYSDPVLGEFKYDPLLDCDEILIANDPTIIPARISISPNPVQDELRLQLTGKEEIASLYLTDIQGRIVLVSNDNSASFSVSSLAPALYFVHIQLQNGETAVLKFVKE